MLNRKHRRQCHAFFIHITSRPVWFLFLVLSVVLVNYPTRMPYRLFDALLYTWPAQSAKQARLVTIDDQDYETYFQSRSPLNAEKLEEVIDAIVAAQPDAIVVDIDTSDPSFAHMPVFDGPPVIWNVDATVRDTGDSKVPASIASTVFTAQPPVGGRALGPNERVALAASQTDDSGYIRDFLRIYEVEQSAQKTAQPAPEAVPCAQKSKQPARKKRLPEQKPAPPAPETAPPTRSILASPAYQAALLLGKERQPTEQMAGASGDLPLLRLTPSDNERAFVRSYTIPQYHVRKILDDRNEDPVKWKNLALFKHQVVVIGGTYRAARDVNFTPAGPLPGCEVVAIQIEQELQGTSIARSVRGNIALIMIVSGILILSFRSVWFIRHQNLGRTRPTQLSLRVRLRSIGINAGLFLLIALLVTLLCNGQLHGKPWQATLLYPAVLLALSLEFFGLVEFIRGALELKDEVTKFIFCLMLRLKSKPPQPPVKTDA